MLLTTMTRFGLWRSAVDLNHDDLQNNIINAGWIMESLMGETDLDDPGVNMWLRHEHALANYGAVMCHRMWGSHGPTGEPHPDICRWAKWQKECREAGWLYTRPGWVTDKEVLSSHRSFLIRSDRKHYAPLFPTISDDLPLLWPQVQLDGSYTITKDL